jgi:MFS family permease
MVFTHLPSNVLLIFVPLMPHLSLAITVLLIRFSISQMDVPARQSYIMAVVSPEERSAPAGVTGVARTIGAALAPIIAGPLLADVALMSVPFFLCGGLKIIYDLRCTKLHGATPEEQAARIAPTRALLFTTPSRGRSTTSRRILIVKRNRVRFKV